MSPDTPLYVYEIEGCVRHHMGQPPPCFVGLWNEDNASYLFFTEAQDAYVNDCLDMARCTLKAKHYTIYAEWQDAMPSAGLTVRGLLFVADDQPSPPKEALRLDPTVVFGDGSHPTTQACLSFLHDLIPGSAIKSVLDLGTGTGILSIAAAALGATEILAIDRNVLAIQTAEKNVRINGLTSRVAVMEGDALSFIGTHYDLAVANLPFEVIEAIAQGEQTVNIPLWVISGISEAQDEIIEKLLTRKGFRRKLFRRDHPWTTCVMEYADSRLMLDCDPGRM